MRLPVLRWPTPLVAAFLAAGLAGCGGSAIKRDADRLSRKCGVTAGSAVSEDQARCIAKLYGVKDRKSCPMEVDRPASYPTPVFRVRESCNGLGVIVAEATGKVVDVLVDGAAVD